MRDSTPFRGIAGVIAPDKARPVDVILVHGICTHDTTWTRDAIDRVAGIVGTHAPPSSAAAAGGIQLVDATRQVAGGTVRFHAIVWSPLTASLKHQLDDDNTGTPTDCVHDAVCKPKRASYNGIVEDWLLNDCLSDAMIYEGDSHAAIRDAMVDTVSKVIQANPNDAGTLVVVAQGLGSKMLFDALSAMLESSQPRTQALGQEAARRHRPPGRGRLHRSGRCAVLPPAAGPLCRARRGGGRCADIERQDWLGLLENPLAAHLDYLANPDVDALIACGYPQLAGCR